MLILTMKEQKSKELLTLKKQYSKLQKKYSLPKFEELNKEFSIEKLSELETEHLLREIRKVISERVFNYFRFIESLLNPQNVSFWIFSFVKALDQEDKKILENIYKKLSDNEMSLIETDLECNEKKEAEFIKESFKLWQEIKEEFLNVVKKTKNNLNKKEQRKSKNYFR